MTATEEAELRQETERLRGQVAALADCATLFLDFYGMETNAFVAKYGRGVSTKTLGDRARLALAKAGLLTPPSSG